MSVISPSQPLGAGTHVFLIQECSEFYVGADVPANVTSITTPDGTVIDISTGAQRVLLPAGDLEVVASGAVSMTIQRRNR